MPTKIDCIYHHISHINMELPNECIPEYMHMYWYINDFDSTDKFIGHLNIFVHNMRSKYSSIVILNFLNDLHDYISYTESEALDCAIDSDSSHNRKHHMEVSDKCDIIMTHIEHLCTACNRDSVYKN